MARHRIKRAGLRRYTVEPKHNYYGPVFGLKNAIRLKRRMIHEERRLAGLLSSREWCARVGISPTTDIMDPDGWDRSSPEAYYESFDVELIGYMEFVERLSVSTVCFTPNIRECFRTYDVEYNRRTR